jgi:D-amino peptidase
MKVFISADIEGVTGVTHWNETDLQNEESNLSREQMTAEVVAACEGALQAGATEIWVKDAHDSGRNLLAAKLPHEARLIRGWAPHPLIMVQELDETFKGLVFIGYHSWGGSGASPLAHTLTTQLVNIMINDHPASEFLIHSYAAANLGVPTVFISGDQGICDEAVKIIPQISTVAVKEGVGNSTVNIHPSLAVTRIREGVKKAFLGKPQENLINLPGHFKVTIQYKELKSAYLYGFFPGAKQINPNTVQFESDDYFEVMRFFLFAA